MILVVCMCLGSHCPLLHSLNRLSNKSVKRSLFSPVLCVYIEINSYFVCYAYSSVHLSRLFVAFCQSFFFACCEKCSIFYA